MSETMIKVENVSKEYRLGVIGGTTLKEELQRKYAKMRHMEDPTAKIGQERMSKTGKFMALSGINFEAKKGEAVGIIGHNGAGKSTLLKLITRITAPTDGKIYLNGRVASMLEVGTGFHGELTGRENIYVNGAILGMTKKEIDSKIEEIIEFSECRQFIDTPVKRYSSGMYVKLAFSVAAHLDSEIVIMDEVLAVGDVAFQNKCIQKMKDIAASGRTVLYVSHNMGTIRSLCDRCIVLSKGQMIFDGGVEEAISLYLKNETSCEKLPIDLCKAKRHGSSSGIIKMKSVDVVGVEETRFEFGKKIKLKLCFDSKNEIEKLYFRIHIKSNDLTTIGVMMGDDIKAHVGENCCEFLVDFSELVPEQYSATFILYERNDNGYEIRHECVEPAMPFTIDFNQVDGMIFNWSSGWGKVCFHPLQLLSE